MAKASRKSPAAESSDDGAFVRRVLIVALIAAVLAVLWLLSHVILLFFGAVLVATTLNAVGQPLQRAGVGHTPAIVIAMVLVAVLIAAAVIFFGADIAEQTRNLATRLSEAAGRVGEQFNIGSLKEIMEGVRPAADIAPLIPGFLSWGVSLGGAILGLLLVLVGGFYLAVDPAPYRDGFIKLVPPAYHANAIATLDDLDEALNRWIAGQLVSMAIIGALTGVGLWLAGVQSPLALGLLAGLANFVPYIGSIAAAIVALVIASSQGLEIVLAAALVMIVIQQIESYVVTPLVVGRRVSIAPATGLFAIVAMAVVFGPLGILFGFPLTIVADIVIRRLYVRDALDEPVEILGDKAEKSSTAAAKSGA